MQTFRSRPLLKNLTSVVKCCQISFSICKSQILHIPWERPRPKLVGKIVGFYKCCPHSTNTSHHQYKEQIALCHCRRTNSKWFKTWIRAHNWKLWSGGCRRMVFQTEKPFTHSNERQQRTVKRPSNQQVRV